MSVSICNSTTSTCTLLEFGDLLRTMRTEACLSQDQFSALLHISRQSYSAYERSERPIPDEVWNILPQVLPLSSDRLTQIQAIRLNLTEEEKDLLSGFRHLDDTRRRQILQYLREQLSP